MKFSVLFLTFVVGGVANSQPATRNPQPAMNSVTTELSKYKVNDGRIHILNARADKFFTPERILRDIDMIAANPNSNLEPMELTDPVPELLKQLSTALAPEQKTPNQFGFSRKSPGSIELKKIGQILTGWSRDGGYIPVLVELYLNIILQRPPNEYADISYLSDQLFDAIKAEAGANPFPPGTSNSNLANILMERTSEGGPLNALARIWKSELNNQKVDLSNLNYFGKRFIEQLNSKGKPFLKTVVPASTSS